MRNKKLLASLLSLALVVSCLPMTANAAEGTINSDVNSKIGGFEVSEEVLASDLEFVSMDDTLQPVSAEEEAALRAAITRPNVTVESVEEGSVAIDATDIAEVETVENLYSDDEVVKAIIVTEDKSLLEQGYEVDDIGSTNSAIKAENALEDSQNEVIEAIEEEVLDGDTLDVEYTYQYMTSGIAANVTYGELKDIANVDGVKTVFVSPRYELDTTEATINTIASANMIKKEVAQNDLGYKGKGSVIAIIDTGIDLTHPSFGALPEESLTENSLTVEDIAEVLPSLNAYDRMDGKVTAKDLYRTTKIAYAFNYVDVNLDVTHKNDIQGDHGTHVAGIAAANQIETSGVIGVAPEAQLVVCKVFGAKGGAYASDYFAAIEDCIVLHVDAINMSLGSPAGFSSEDEEVDNILDRVADSGIVMSVSAGNSYSSAYENSYGYNLNTVDNPDNGIVYSPSTFLSSTSIASIDSNGIATNEYFSLNGENIALLAGTYPDGYTGSFSKLLGEKTVEYAMVDNCGQVLKDFETANVKGKVAVVSRGITTFASKMALAKQAGAIGVIIYNNTAGSISMDLTSATVSECIPTASIKMSEGEKLKNAAVKEITISDGKASLTFYDNDSYYIMSGFSSWGVAPDLNLIPDITAPGGNIYSTLDNGTYGSQSGTSMAAPQVAGCFALMKERLRKEYPELRGYELYTVTNALLMSTAEPVVAYNDEVNDVEYSPRKQGAGLANLEKALTAETYLSVPNADKPSVSLYDDPDRTGKYSFTFDVVNMDDKAVTYDLDASVLTESVFTGEDGTLFMAEEAICLDDAKVAFSTDSVTVDAHGKASVSVDITLSEDDKEYMDTYFKNGIYVEGFVYLTSKDAVDLSLPYMGFYGDWTKGAMLDTGYYDEPESEAKMHWDHTIYTMNGKNKALFGANPYDVDSTVMHKVVSPNGDKINDTISAYYLGLLRNAKDISFTFTDKATDTIVDKRVSSYVRKEYYSIPSSTMYPGIVSDETDELYDFTDKNGKALADGTVLSLDIVATLDFDKHAINNLHDTWSVDEILVDTKAPELISTVYADGKLTVTAKDEGYMAGVAFADLSGKVLSRVEMTGELGDTITKTFDVDGFGQEFYVVLGDYGVNQSIHKVICSGNAEFVETLGLAGINADKNTIDTINRETGETIPLIHADGFDLVAADVTKDGSIVFICIENDYNFVLKLPVNDGVYGEFEIIGALPADTFDIRDISYDIQSGKFYMAGGEDSNIYVIDFENNEIKVVSLAGRLGSIDAITVDNKGNVYLADDHGLVTKLSASGSLTEIINFKLSFDGKYTSSLEYNPVDDQFYYGINVAAFGQYEIAVFSGNWKQVIDEIIFDDVYNAIFTILDKEYVKSVDIVTELGSWVSGSYALNDAKAENNAKRIRLTESLKVTANDTYEAVVSNPAFNFIIRKVDGNGKVSTFYLSNGDRFKAEENATYYACVYNVYNNYKDLDFAMYQDFFRSGMVMNLKNVSEIAANEKNQIENELGIWKSGTYNQSTASFEGNKQRIYLDGAYETVAGHEYEAVVSDDSFRFIVRKVDNETNTVSTSYLANGEKFVAEEGYTYYLTSQNYLGKYKDVTFQTYVGLFENGFVFTIKDLNAPEEVEETTEEETEEIVEDIAEETADTVESSNENIEEFVEESEDSLEESAEETSISETVDGEVSLEETGV